MSRLRERPDNFRLNSSHSLAQGLVFAGLGGFPGSLRYVDASGYGNHGEFLRMPASNWVWDNTLNRFALDFKEGSDECVFWLTQAKVHELTTQMTCSVWHKTAGNYTSTQSLMANSDGGGNPSPFCLAFGDTDNKYTVYGGGGIDIDFTTSIASADNWHHVCFTRSGSAGAWSYDMYLDGTLDRTVASIINPNTGGACYFGLGTWGNWYYGFLIGKLSDPLLYSRVLSPVEIQQLADPSNVMLSGMIEPPKRKLWPVYTTSTYKIKRIARLGRLMVSSRF